MRMTVEARWMLGCHRQHLGRYRKCLVSYVDVECGFAKKVGNFQYLVGNYILYPISANRWHCISQMMITSIPTAGVSTHEH